MKLAHISQCYQPVIGGQEVYIKNLQEVFRANGIDGVVFQPNKGVSADDVRTVVRPRFVGRLLPGSEAHLFNLLLRLSCQRQLEEFDVIVAHYALHAWPQRKHCEKTIVLSHGVEWHMEDQNWDDRARERAARRCFDRFPHVVNDTHYLRTMGMDVPPGQGCFEEVAPRKWFIPNCVDPQVFCAGEGHASLAGRKVILVPRQITPDRGIHLAIKSFKLLADEDRDLEMCILGKRRPGPYGILLDGLITDLGLSDRVYFAEGVANAEMPAWYNGAVLTMIPTLRREGTSLSALESMSCGTPVVSTNVAGLADLPTVQADPEESALAKAVLEVLADRDRIALEQQRAVRETFNLENWGAAWVKVIEAVGGNPASGV